jgi:hypothetical protein
VYKETTRKSELQGNYKEIRTTRKLQGNLRTTRKLQGNLKTTGNYKVYKETTSSQRTTGNYKAVGETTGSRKGNYKSNKFHRVTLGSTSPDTRLLQVKLKESLMNFLCWTSR